MYYLETHFFNNINKKEAEHQTEVTFAKMRWNEKRKIEEDLEPKKRIYDIESGTIDLSNKKATEMRSNQRVKLIDPDIDDQREIKRENLKLELIETYSEYIDKHCNRNPEIKNVMVGNFLKIN